MRVETTTARRGASAVEFGLCLPFALLAIVGMCDFAMWTLARHTLSRAVQDATTMTAKLAIPDGSDDGTYLEDTAESMTMDSLSLWGAGFAATTVVAQWRADDEDIMWLEVSANMPFEPIMGWVSPFKRDIQRHFIVITQEQRD